MVRVSMAIDGVITESDTLANLDSAIETARAAASAKLDDLIRDREARLVRRDASFDFIVSTMNESWDPLSKRLREIAKSPSGSVAEIIAANTVQPPRSQA